MKIVLLGYMASGKSAVGKILAKKMNLQFIDLDDFIEEKEQQSITDIFKTKGEIYFRQVEGVCLQELLNLSKKCIISVGGGTPCYGNNLELIKEKAISFYLKASINTIFERLKHETSQRPLVATIGIDNLQEYIAKHLFERASFYDEADFSIVVNDKDLKEIVGEIDELL
ncbi:shikimate kinase [Lutibacter agarilyticus]|uniref:Shikimate kinase n=1 Tax=Lutibacter agarilyticus TaxID=1109740 RepID=A0A238VGT6_9FLAO|nr:shikimate kinase [Lutibacter agarilyticus]SNR33600.1 shikimate kinase [Lutibacter agarilyticus]